MFTTAKTQSFPLQPASSVRPWLRKGHTLLVRGRPAVIQEIARFGARPRTLHLLTLRYVDGYLPAQEHLFLELESDLQPSTAFQADFHSQVLPEPFLNGANEWIRDNLIPFPGVPGIPDLSRPSKAPERPDLALAELDPGFTSPVSVALSGPTPDPHQLVPLEKALQRRQVRLLLADEPGLGKTGQAALIANEMLLRRRAFRILVLCPPGLRANWQAEMRRFANLEFDVVDGPTSGRAKGNAGIWEQTDRAIASYYWFKQPQILRHFLEAQQHSGPAGPWDLLIVDEAHHLIPPAGTTSQLHSALGQIVGWFPHRVFITATPHSGYTDSLTGLLQLLDPLRFDRTQAPSASMRSAMRDVVIRRSQGNVFANTVQARPAQVSTIKVPTCPDEAPLHQAWQRACTAISTWTAADADCAGRWSLALQVLRKRMLSSLPAFASSFQALLRALRCPQPTETIAEQEADGQEPWSDSARNLLLLAQRHQLPLWQRLDQVNRCLEQVRSADALLMGSRLKALISWIVSRKQVLGTEKILVFTEFSDSQRALVLGLAQCGLPEGSVAGLDSSAPAGRRTDTLNRFCDPDDPLRVLVTTDVASEGLNLQEACRCVVHLDLPWNPGRLIQRTGRVLRRGQTRRVTELFVAGSAPEESAFLKRLAGKERRTTTDLGDGQSKAALPHVGQGLQKPAASPLPGLEPPTQYNVRTGPPAVCQDLVPNNGPGLNPSWREWLGPSSGILPLASGSWCMARLRNWHAAPQRAALLALARWLALDKTDGWLLKWAMPLWFGLADWPASPSLGPPAFLNPGSMGRLLKHSGIEPLAHPYGAAELQTLLVPLQVLLEQIQRQAGVQMPRLLKNQASVLRQQEHQIAARLLRESNELPAARQARRRLARLQIEGQRALSKGYLFAHDRLALRGTLCRLEAETLRTAQEAARLQACALLDPEGSAVASRLLAARTHLEAPPSLVLEAVALLVPGGHQEAS